MLKRLYGLGYRAPHRKTLLRAKDISSDAQRTTCNICVEGYSIFVYKSANRNMRCTGFSIRGIF